MSRRKKNVGQPIVQQLTPPKPKLSIFEQAGVWVRRNPFLSFLLGGVFFGGLTISRFIRTNNTSQSETRMVRCGEWLENFTPESSPVYTRIRESISKDCTDVEAVPEIFMKAKVNAHIAFHCLLQFNQYKEKIIECNKMKDKFKRLEKAKNTTVDPKLPGLRLIPEGHYEIIDSKQTIATIGISACVGVAITSPDSSQVLLAHINGENILAHNEFLKGRSQEDPFIEIRNFVTNQKMDWQVTLVSGSAMNIAYINTMLEAMGLSNIDDNYYEGNWALPSWVNSNIRMLNQGNLVIQNGKATLIKNIEDFQGLFKTIPADQKNKPTPLKMMK